MMMEAMFEIDFNGKRVLDFGTGTGILAILAEKMGASDVLAIDNDHWSYENALENIQKNHATKVTVQLKDDLVDLDSFDIILANINKNVLTEHALDLRQLLVSNGCLIISGLLSTDYDDICLKYDPLFGPSNKHFSESGWIALSFKL
jgi:ribosomal protein L11 methyltransferase